MTYNFSLFPRVGSCIPTHTAFITNPWCHNRFNLDHHNHFKPYCYNNFNPCYNVLELNIQLPECPACPEPKKPIDFSKLTIAVDAISGEIKDAITKESSGLLFAKCKEIIDKTDNNLEIGPDNRIRGGCDSSSECKACVDAINASIVDSRKEPASFSEGMPILEDSTFIL